MSTTLTPSASTSTSEINAVVGTSPRQLARMAGLLYLINILGGAFAIGIVPAIVVCRSTGPLDSVPRAAG